MKILFLAPDSNLRFEQSGGAGTHIRASVTELRKRGHEVMLALGGDLLFPSGSANKPQAKPSGPSLTGRLVPEFVKRLFRDRRRQRLSAQVLQLVRQMIERDGKPDIIYERSGYGYDVGMKLAAEFIIPRCMETDVIMLDLMRNETSWLYNRWIYRSLEQKKYNTADSITVQSEASIQIAKKYWGLQHDRVYNKDLGISPGKMEPDATERVDEKYGLQGKTVFGFVGIFLAYQNIPILLEAAKYLRDLSDELAIMLVGSGKDIENYKDKVRRDGLKNVVFTGLVDKQVVGSYYDRIDVGVIPDCAYHMYPVKFLEFGLFRKLVITPSYDVFSRFYDDQSLFNRLSFSPGSSRQLAERIRAIHESRSGGDLLGQEAQAFHKFVLDHHTWAACGEKLEAALHETLGLRQHNAKFAA